MIMIDGNISALLLSTGCSPVLIPAKVVQALKVHFDRVGELPQPNATGFSIQNIGTSFNIKIYYNL